MKFFNMRRRYYEEAGGDGAQGGGGGTGDASGSDDGSGDGGTAAAVAAAVAASGAGGTGDDKTAAAIQNVATGKDGSWRDALPEDIRTSDALKNFNDVSGLAKAFVDTKRMQGNSIHIPGEDASDEQRRAFVDKLIERVPGVMLKPDFEHDGEQSAEFWRSLGAPENGAGYEMPEVQLNDNEDFEVDNDRIDVMREAAAKVGVTKHQFKSVMDAVLKHDIENQRSIGGQQNESMRTLHQEWGMAFEQNYAAALQVARATGAPDVLIDAIKNAQAGPETLKWLYAVGKNMGKEGQNILNQGDGTTTRLTPAEAQQKIDEIMNNKNHPYWDASHPSHASAMQEMVKLHEAKRPTM